MRKRRISKLLDAPKPRICDLSKPTEAKAFKQSLGTYRLEGMLRDCHNSPQDRRIIQTAYVEYMRALTREDSQSLESFASLSESSEASDKESSGSYEGLKGAFEDPQLYESYVKQM